MRAIVLEKYGGPEVVQFRENAPVPVPRDGEILVKVASAGVNFMDVHTRQGKYADSRTYEVGLPCTLGMEGAGRIVALGRGVTDLQVGDRVAWCIAWGSFADYARIPAARVARLPEEIDFELAAASMFQGCTAHYLVNDVAKLTARSSCLVLAGSGAIGQLLIQLAKRVGAFVIATASTLEKCAIASERGADHAILYENGQFADIARSLTDARGVDVVFDSVGKATLRDSMRAARKQGLVVNYGNVSGSVKNFDPLELGEAGSLFLTRPRLADYMSTAEIVRYRASAVFSGLIEGALAVNIAHRYALNEVLDGLARIERREQIGKAIAIIDSA